MSDALDAHPEHRDGDKAVIMLMNDDEGKGGLVAHGYDDDGEAAADLFLHLKAIFEVNGKTLVLASAGERPPD
jgi:hypothetical protein